MIKLLVSTIWESTNAVGGRTDVITSAGVLFFQEDSVDSFPAQLSTLLVELKNENEAKLQEQSEHRRYVSLRLHSHSITKL